VVSAVAFAAMLVATQFALLRAVLRWATCSGEAARRARRRSSRSGRPEEVLGGPDGRAARAKLEEAAFSASWRRTRRS
jgi:hypothetical protein